MHQHICPLIINFVKLNYLVHKILQTRAQKGLLFVSCPEKSATSEIFVQSIHRTPLHFGSKEFNSQVEVIDDTPFILVSLQRGCATKVQFLFETLLIHKRVLSKPFDGSMKICRATMDKQIACK